MVFGSGLNVKKKVACICTVYVVCLLGYFGHHIPIKSSLDDFTYQGYEGPDLSNKARTNQHHRK